MSADADFMAECYRLAAVAAERGDSPVGSVVVQKDEIIGWGFEASRARRDITYHAEIEAVRDAVRQTGSQNLENCTLYTTHEPCVMCSYVVRHARISRVVIAERVVSVGGVSSAYPILTARDISVWGEPPEVVFL